jgi:protoheme IX farnesyltransferase
VKIMIEARGDVQPSSPASPWLYLDHVRSRGLDYLYLVKARLSLMVVLSAMVAYWLGTPAVDLAHLVTFALGTFLVVGGANAFNQFLERDLDSRMERTRGRPLPTGRIPVSEAVAAATILSAAGVLVLFLIGGAMTGGLGLLALGIYVLVYTPMKTRSPWSTFVGAISGAIPTLMGFAAVSGSTGSLPPLAWCLFGLLFFWQFPHTWAIAATYRDDYERVGYRALPGRGVRFVTMVTTLAVVATSLLPSALGLTGSAYPIASFVLGGMFLAAAFRFGNGTVRSRASTLLAVSLFYLPLILAIAALNGKVS